MPCIVGCNMDLYLLNNQLDKIAHISAFTSLIWVRRYNEAGEFELYVSAKSLDIRIFEEDQFLIRSDDSTVMVIEKIQLPEDVEKGDYLIVSGRSAESLLDRRVNMTRFAVGEYASLYDAIYPLLDVNILANAEPDRQIPILACTPYGRETSPIYVTGDRFGSNLYEYTRDTCKGNQSGFDVRLVDKKLMIGFYKGVDRSITQSVNPHVVFSPDFGNLLTSEYKLDRSSEKNIAFVAGEGEGAARKTVIVGAGTGLKRKELYVDARDLSSSQEVNDQTVQMPDDEYQKLLENRGIEKLADRPLIESFDFTIDISRTYRYKIDFNVGDIVTGRNKYGISSNARIIEMSEVFDSSGYKLVPKMEV